MKSPNLVYTLNGVNTAWRRLVDEVDSMTKASWCDNSLRPRSGFLQAEASDEAPGRRLSCERGTYNWVIALMLK